MSVSDGGTISGDSEMEMEDSSDSDVDNMYAYGDDIDMESRQAPFEILTPEKVRARKAEALQQTAAVTMLPVDEAGHVLRHFKWDQAAASQGYFGNMNGVREQLGLVGDPDAAPVPPASDAKSPTASPVIKRTRSATRAPAAAAASAKQTCNVCFDDYDPGDMLSAACGHPFCKDCWRGYCTTTLADGLRVLDLRCPQDGCSAAVLRPTLAEVLTPWELMKYDEFSLRSFVEDSSAHAWCPTADCPYVAHSCTDSRGEAQDITCECGATFCFTCKEEAHRPVDCDTVSKWITKNTAESENLNWILVNTKPCPKCRRPIEKNQGCMHMTCAQCRHGFCWLCLTAWKDHGTGGFYACNRFEKAQKSGHISEEESRRQNAKQSLERYTHYYERFAENEKSQKTAISQAADFLAEDLEALSERTSDPTSLLKMISDAWAQVVDCRRILKWTYAYGYYTFEPPELRADDEPKHGVSSWFKGKGSASKSSIKQTAEDLAQKQEFFEFSQGQAEKYLEALQKMVEKDVQPFLPRVAIIPLPRSEWEAYKSRLVSTTALALDHFTKLVTELNGGMDALLDRYGPAAGGGQESSQPEEEASAGGSEPARRSRTAKRSHVQNARAAEAAEQAAEQDTHDGSWACGACTMFHQAQDAELVDCSVCSTPRDNM